jgi:putative membrane protein
MYMVSQIIIGLLALFHFYILFIEMFAWETRGKKVFGNPTNLDIFSKTKDLAANLGLYNGFLAAGLVWSLFINNAEWHNHVATFFLSCITVAGIFGATKAGIKILFFQTVPALIALLFLYLSSY